MSRRRRSDPETERPLHRAPAASRRGNRVFYVQWRAVPPSLTISLS